jgi:hypothetical protein
MGPVPGVGAGVKRPQGLLNAGGPFPFPASRRQDFVAEAGASRKSVGSWELFVGTSIEW